MDGLNAHQTEMALDPAKKQRHSQRETYHQVSTNIMQQTDTITQLPSQPTVKTPPSLESRKEALGFIPGNRRKPDTVLIGGRRVAIE